MDHITINQICHELQMHTCNPTYLDDTSTNEQTSMNMCWSIASVKLLTKNIHSHHINIYVSDLCHSGTIFEYPIWISHTSTLEKWTNSVFWLWITIIGQTFNKKHSFPFQLHVLEPLVSCAILFEHVRVPRDDEKRTHGVFLHFF